MIPYALIIFEFLLLASMALSLIRVAKGPTVADRLVAIDLLGLLVATLLFAQGVKSKDESMLDIVLVFSVISFLGAVILARFLQLDPSSQTSKK